MKKWAHQMILGVLALCPLLFVGALASFLQGLFTWNALQEEGLRIHAHAAHLSEAQQRDSSLLEGFYRPSPRYLGEQIETLRFLGPEMKKLEALQKEHPDTELLATRLRALKSPANQLLFAEEEVRATDRFREIEERQERPVEMNEEDLKRLLCLIEGVTIWPYGAKEGRPLLIIKDLKLSKKDLLAKEKSFVISMDLIKREALESLP
jgi:hypothetical protein